MTSLPPGPDGSAAGTEYAGDGAPGGGPYQPVAYVTQPVQYVQAPVEYVTQPGADVPVYAADQQVVTPIRPTERGVWFWPLMVLLALSALGGGIGLLLHEMRGETTIETGQCLTDLASVPGNNLASLLAHRVPCAEPHEAEVIAVVNPPSGMREEEIGNWPNETCGYRFEDYVGLPSQDSEIHLGAFPVFTTADNVAGEGALRDAFNNGNWKLICIAQHGDTSTGSVRNARR